MGQRDDRVVWSMQWVALVVVPVLLPALVILWGMPGAVALAAMCVALAAMCAAMERSGSSRA